MSKEKGHPTAGKLWRITRESAATVGAREHRPGSDYSGSLIHVERGRSVFIDTDRYLDNAMRAASEKLSSGRK